MHHKKRSIGFILATLCTFTLLLAGCRTGAPAHRQTQTQNTTRLKMHETPGIMDNNATPGTATPGAAITGPAEYVGRIEAEKAWIGLSTSGKDVIAFVTDGSQGHKPTFAQWFKGSVANGVVDITTPAKNGSDRLQAMLGKDDATGTVTLADGKSLPFTANPVPDSDKTAGLYRGESTVNNQHYVAGWVVMPAAGAGGTATPSATGTPRSDEGTVPPLTGNVQPDATDTATPSATETTTPSATETTTPSTTGAVQEGGAIVNEQNHTVMPAVPLTKEQINAKQLTIPNLGTIKLTLCQKGKC